MPNSTKDSSDKVSLEELLRFKRFERPDEAFWDSFDHELHQRMMQALVKKDPWPVQLMRGLSGKFAQSSAIAAAAAALALAVVRPALVTSVEHNQPVVAEIAAEEPLDSASVQTEDESVLLAEADYAIEVLTAAASDFGGSVTSDYGLDHMDVASYDSAAYSTGMSLATVTSTGLASLVY